MKVMLLCGGMGTRLREITETRPKPMVEIGGRPILWHIMKLYAHYGMTEFIICLGYKGQMIKEYFLNYEAMNSDFTVELGKKDTIQIHNRGHAEEGWKVTLADTGELTMTGGRIKRASLYLEPDDETFAVTYGDGVSDVNLQASLELHRSAGTLGTLTGVRPPSRFGEIVARDNRVEKFMEKPQVDQGLVNGGFFFFQRKFLDYLSDDPGCILERAPIEQCVADGQMSIYEHPGYWQCMDTYRDWQHLEKLWQKGQAPWKVW